MFKDISKRLAGSSETSGQNSTVAVQEQNMQCELDNTREINVGSIMTDENKSIEPLRIGNDNNDRVMGMTEPNYNLKNILERETFIQTVSWSSTEASGTVIGSPIYLLPDLKVAPQINSKLSYFAYLRADMCATVKITPQPFNQGMVMVAAVPRQQITAYGLPSMVEASFLPHSMMNISVMNNATLELPFLSSREAYQLTWNPSYEGWVLVMYTIIPLTGAVTPVSLDIEVYANFVKPELLIPYNAVAQAGENEMEETNETGIVTKVSGVVSDVLQVAGPTLSSIPVVGTFVPPLTWLARVTNKVSSYFGWSKPINLRAVTIVSPNVGYRMCNGEGQDNSVALALSPDNAVDSATNSLVKVDEMDINYLVGRKSLHDVYQYTFNVGEQSVQTVNVNIPNVRTPKSWALYQAEYARYTMNFEFHIVKTRFHTGRLMVMFDRADNVTTMDEMKAAMNTQYFKIIDIATTDRFYFSIPWTANFPFNRSNWVQSPIKIGVWNEIRAPDTVSQSISIVAYTSYSDVEVGCPISIVAQGCCSNDEPIPVDPLIPYEGGLLSPFCMGESLTSLRLLIKRFSFHSAIVGDGFSTEYLIDDWESDDYADNPASLAWRINSLYAYRAGSIRYKFVFPSNLNLRVTLRSPTASQVIAGNPTQFFMGHLTNVAEITLPYYNSVRRSEALYPWMPLHLALLDENMAEVGLPNSARILVYVAMGDDYSAYMPCVSYPTSS